jgi:hypothetical protein
VNLDSIRTVAALRNANLPLPGAQATTFALILDMSGLVFQLIWTAVMRYIMFKRVGRWHGLRLTEVPAAANLL